MDTQEVEKLVDSVFEEQLEEPTPDKTIVLGKDARGGRIAKPLDRMFTDQAIIYGIFRTKEIPKNKIKYSIVWNCVKGHKEPNYEILKMDKEYDPTQEKKENLEKNKDFMIIFDLRNQRRVLPPGDYRVSVYIDDVFQKSKDFVLEKRLGLYLGRKLGKHGVEDPEYSFDGHILIVFGMYHFDKVKAIEKQGEEIGKIKWLKLGEKKEDKEEVLQVTPIKPEGLKQYDCFKFHIAKPPNGFQVGKYKCCVLVDDKQVAEKEFEITERKPRLFLGTIITKFGDIIDDSAAFPGTIKVLKGVYKFCRVVPKTSKGKIKWYLMQAVSLDKPALIGESEIGSKKDYDYFAFQMDFSKAKQTVPGTYKCEVYLDDELVESKFFRITPVYNIVLGDVVNGKIEKPTNVFMSGVQEIKGMLQTNYVFPKGTIVTTFWFATKAMGLAANSLIFNSKKQMDQQFRHLLISCKLKGMFPVGKYMVVIGINGSLVSAKEFTILDKAVFGANPNFQQMLQQMPNIQNLPNVQNNPNSLLIDDSKPKDILSSIKGKEYDDL